MEHVLNKVPYTLVVQNLTPTAPWYDVTSVNASTTEDGGKRICWNIHQSGFGIEYIEIDVTDERAAAEHIQYYGRLGNICFYVMPVNGGARTLACGAKKWAKGVLDR